MVPERPVSPCISVCVLDANNDSCTGCRRTVNEIARWGRMSPGEQWAVIARIEQVRAEERRATDAAAVAARG